MGSIRERKTKEGSIRYQAEVRLKGHPTLTATFDRKTDAKKWVQKTEADIRCDRHQIYSERKRHTLKEAIDRYFREQDVSVVKRGHLDWWSKELGHHYLSDIRPARIAEKKQKLLTKKTPKGIVRCGSTANRYLATLSHLMSFFCRSMVMGYRKSSKKDKPRKGIQGEDPILEF